MRIVFMKNALLSFHRNGGSAGMIRVKFFLAGGNAFIDGLQAPLTHRQRRCEIGTSCDVLLCVRPTQRSLLRVVVGGLWVLVVDDSVKGLRSRNILRIGDDNMPLGDVFQFAENTLI
ncbi:hypothetical protein WI95_23640 [Burkholderia contaminans]|nr:hypothetical protein WI95_23640 [Burkholderia contaminans]